MCNLHLWGQSECGWHVPEQPASTLSQPRFEPWYRGTGNKPDNILSSTSQTIKNIGIFFLVCVSREVQKNALMVSGSLFFKLLPFFFFFALEAQLNLYPQNLKSQTQSLKIVSNYIDVRIVAIFKIDQLNPLLDSDMIKGGFEQVFSFISKATLIHI